MKSFFKLIVPGLIGLSVIALVSFLILILTYKRPSAQSLYSDEGYKTLAANLRQASDFQNICYEWSISEGQFPYPINRNLSSSVTPTSSQCSMTVTYRGEATKNRKSTGGGSATLSDNVTSQSTIISGDFGADPGVAFFRAISQLPALAAESGLGPWVPVEANVDPLPKSAQVKSIWLPDWVNDNMLLIVVTSVTLCGSLLISRGQRHAKVRRSRRSEGREMKPESIEKRRGRMAATLRGRDEPPSTS